MSTQINTYVMIGAKYPLDEFERTISENLNLPKDDEDAAIELICEYRDSAYGGIEHHKGLCVLHDVYSGKWVVIGRVIQKSEEHSFLGDPYECVITQEQKDLIAGAIDANFGIKAAPISLWVFSYYR